MCPSSQLDPAALEAAALALARSRVQGGPDAPVFKRPFVSAAFGERLYFWDTCFNVCWARHHHRELPIEAALDNFYLVQDADGFIGREIRPDGRSHWPKHHPISVNPPILAWAELQFHETVGDTSRLARVYPALVRYHDYCARTFRGDDGLYFSDALGSGMDNLVRAPRDWEEDGLGLVVREGENYDVHRRRPFSAYYYTRWNRQGRSVDYSAQIAFDALNLARIARILGDEAAASRHRSEHAELVGLLNRHCWSESRGFYFDLAFGRLVERWHLGMYWLLLAEAVPVERLSRFLAPLSDPAKFGRPVPWPALAADDPDYRPWGDYWRGGVWAPTSYMVLRGLRAVGREDLAAPAARRLHDIVAEVFRRTGTFWENYSPEFAAYGHPALPDFCGWTALIPVSLSREGFVS